MSEQSVSNYEVIGKGIVERGGDHVQYALKLLYRGDKTPWWTCNSGLEWVCSKDFFDSFAVGDYVRISLEKTP